MAHLVPPTVPEVRRLLHIARSVLDETARAFHLDWSVWRRRHQVRAGCSHDRRRLAAPDARAPLIHSTK
jgi:hypothetical protein